jgi:hypothetical protein
MAQSIAGVGEGYDINIDRLRFMARRNGGNGIIEVAGGLAVVRMHVEAGSAAPFCPPLLLGVSARTDGTGGEIAVHGSYIPEDDACTPWCHGLTVKDGVTETTESAPFGFPSSMLSMFCSPASRDVEPSDELVRAFYEGGHTFDPATQPLLHAAFEQVVGCP